MYEELFLPTCLTNRLGVHRLGKGGSHITATDNSGGTVIRAILISVHANILHKSETANSPWPKQFAPSLKIPINHRVIYH